MKCTVAMIVGAVLLGAMTFPAAAQVQVNSVVWAESDPCNPEANYRLRASLAYMNGDKAVVKPLSFWKDLEIREITTNFSTEGRTVAVQPLGQGEEKQGKWRIIVLVDASRSMLRREANVTRRFETALNALDDQFISNLEGLDVEVAIETFGCSFRWAHDYTDAGRVRWLREPAAMRQQVAEIHGRFRSLLGTRARRSPLGMCTALYQAVSEADRYLSQRIEQGDPRQPLLVVIGDGINDLYDPPGAVWNSGMDPHRPFNLYEYIASPDELRGGDLGPLLRRMQEDGVVGSAREGLERMDGSYRRFIRELGSRPYFRWAISVGGGGDIFDQDVIRAFGRPPIPASNQAALDQALDDLVGVMFAQVNVNFPTPARSRAELNDLGWEFFENGRSVGRFVPEGPLVFGLGSSPVPMESWEEPAYRCAESRTRGPWIPFFAVLAVLLLLWFLVPSYVFSEAT